MSKSFGSAGDCSGCARPASKGASISTCTYYRQLLCAVMHLRAPNLANKANNDDVLLFLPGFEISQPSLFEWTFPKSSEGPMSDTPVPSLPLAIEEYVSARSDWIGD